MGYLERMTAVKSNIKKYSKDKPEKKIEPICQKIDYGIVEKITVYKQIQI